jgi:hypothetical protein
VIFKNRLVGKNEYNDCPSSCCGCSNRIFQNEVFSNVVRLGFAFGQAACGKKQKMPPDLRVASIFR